MATYMVVTNDIYELPLAVCENLKLASDYLGLSKQAVSNRINRDGWKQMREKVVCVESKDRDKVVEYSAKYRKSHDRSEYFNNYYREKRCKKMQ